MGAAVRDHRNAVRNQSEHLSAIAGIRTNNHRECKVETIVRDNLSSWQDEGLVPDMPIEPGDKTDEPIRTRGWTHWHHLFGARVLLVIATMKRLNNTPIGLLEIARSADRLSKLCRYNANPQPKQGPKIEQVFSNQALNPMIKYGIYSYAGIEDYTEKLSRSPIPRVRHEVETMSAALNRAAPDILVTDPPKGSVRGCRPRPTVRFYFNSRRAAALPRTAASGHFLPFGAISRVIQADACLSGFFRDQLMHPTMCNHGVR
jgi:hypothetical protein